MTTQEAEYEPPKSPDLICIDESKGYVPGNIMVVSHRAATIIERLREVRATPEELRRTADFIERVGLK
ncbi:MAG: hypothetical protein ACREHE_00920 [Rhizomicrobium sp.]